MKLSRSAHTERPWRIHELAPDFEVQDVWSCRTPGAGPDDFPMVLAAMRVDGEFAAQAPPVRFLLAVRHAVGVLFGWDRSAAGLDTRVRPLRDRLPQDLRDTVDEGTGGAFSPVYRLDDEDVRELANRTVHGLMHLGWVPTGGGEHELRMAVLVKPNGRLGRVYMALIAPFRHLVVYPLLTRQFERAWRDRDLRAPSRTGPAPSSR